VTRNFHVWAEILMEVGDEEYLLHALNLMPFENMSQMLWPNMLLFLSG